MIAVLFVVWQIFLSITILGMFCAAYLCVHMILDMTDVDTESIKSRVISWVSLLTFMYVGCIAFNTVWSW